MELHERIRDAGVVGAGGAGFPAHVKAGSVVGAGALVPEGLDVPERSMVLGVPGRVKPLPDQSQNEWIDYGVGVYLDFVRRYPEAMARVDLDDCRVH